MRGIGLNSRTVFTHSLDVVYSGYDIEVDS